MEKRISVGMGEIAVSSDPAMELMCLGLGSCIAVCVYERARRLGLMVHVVLPSTQQPDHALPGKYADTAIPLIVEELRKAGGRKEMTRVVLCGGAAIFASLEGVLDIGRRNLEAVRSGLREQGLRVVKEEVGGRSSRTLTLNVGTGQVSLRTVASGEQSLVNLGE